MLNYHSQSSWGTISQHDVKKAILHSDSFLLGCGNPPTPSQSTLQCARGVGSCFVTCKPGHALPDGRQRIVMRCENGQWQVSKLIFYSKTSVTI